MTKPFLSSTHLTNASFFSGFGLLDLGLHRAGFETVFQCEREPYALQVLNARFPGVPRHDDIRTLAVDIVPPALLWSGGFPCQDVSLAGKRAGVAQGKRSSLVFLFLRLARTARPSFLLLENVPGLRTNGCHRVLRAIFAAGYTALEPAVVAAGDLGAGHRRERVFILAVRTDLADSQRCRLQGGQRQPEPSELRRRSADQSEASSAMAHSLSAERWPDTAHREHDSSWHDRRRTEASSRSPVADSPMADAHNQRQLQPSGGVGDIRERVGQANPDSQRLPGRKSKRDNTQPQQPPTQRDCDSDRLRTVAQSAMGRNADGCPNWLERYATVAPPGPEQYPWEPPRTCDKLPHRIAQLQGLGNGVEVRTAELIGRALVRFIGGFGHG